MRKKISNKKLAKAARELAYRCAAGTAPEFGVGMAFVREYPPDPDEVDQADASAWEPYCALGHAYDLAGYNFYGWINRSRDEDLERLVWYANDNATAEDRNDAVIFPLLAFADELEAA